MIHPFAEAEAIALQILEALFPCAMFFLGLILGRMGGKLNGQLLYMRRISAALRELKNRYPLRTPEEFNYWQGYFHGIIHISEGKPPDDLRVDSLIQEIE